MPYTKKNSLTLKAEYLIAKEEYLSEKEKCFTQKGKEFFNKLEDFKYISPKTQCELFEPCYNEGKKRYFSKNRKPKDVYLEEKTQYLGLKNQYLNLKEYYLAVKQNYLKDQEDIFIPTEEYLILREEFNKRKTKFFENEEKRLNKNQVVTSKEPLKITILKRPINESLTLSENESGSKFGDLLLDHLTNNGYNPFNERMYFYSASFFNKQNNTFVRE